MPAVIGFRTRSQGQHGHEALLAQTKMRANSQGYSAPGRQVVHKPRDPAEAQEAEALSPIPSSRMADNAKEYPEDVSAQPPSNIHASHEPSQIRGYALKEDREGPLSSASKRILKKMKHGKSSRDSPERQVRKSRRQVIDADNDDRSERSEEDDRESSKYSPKRSIASSDRPGGPRMRQPKAVKKQAWHGPWLALPKLCQVNLRRKECEREIVGGAEERIVKERLRFMNMERGMEWGVLAAAAQKADAHAKLVCKLPPIFGSYQGSPPGIEVD
eukprot:gnl/MRDRNA2_/MRDRNA2_45230_c0_seq1.p1 gnl/MRDRNA2_/MRDRNA2_45230_c0~~gnl/MRDRNA2_/MRDRNA2_45230_c0_seq1.p1  ORF type:complete len:273 (+),score=53.45 gnl/MRDRNA2_/MRDRNA2_45230_c0_seq1:82-900(+)